MFNFAALIPVNLIRKPLEYAIIVIWLAAIAQFFNFAFVNLPAITLDWYITAFALMIAALFIAIRFNSLLPFFAIFLLGITLVLVFFNPQLDENVSLLLMTFYAFIFWLFWRYFLKSGFFLKVYQIIRAQDNAQNKQITAFSRLCFYLSFLLINSCVILALDFDAYWHKDSTYSLAVFILAMVFVFVCEDYISEQGRGVLLPVYMTFILMSYINIHSSDLFIWAFILWLGHNIISSFYNKMMQQKKINTELWPWYGLLLVFFTVFNHIPQSFISIVNLSLLLVYLLLMLRNTAQMWLGSVLILTLFSVFLVLLIPDRAINEPLTETALTLSAYYAQALLLFALCLLAVSVLWDAYLNPFLIHIGWYRVSLRSTIIVLAYTIALYYLLVNTAAALALMSYRYIFPSEFFAAIEPLLLVLLLLALFLFKANKITANLIHFSIMLALIIVWNDDYSIPVYLLFALFYLIWIILPLLLNYLAPSRAIKFAQNLQFDSNKLVETSINWVILSCIVSISSLISEMSHYSFDFTGMDVFTCLLLLFAGALILVKTWSHTKAGDLWHLMAYLLAAALLVSLRMLLMGTQAVNTFDTAGLLVISFIFYRLRRLPCLSSTIINADHLAKILPLLALLTIPWTIGSLHSSLTLFVLGVFYLVIEASRIRQYGAFVLLNLAVYLWIPVLSDYSGLLLFYALPVAVSVLFVTHLHRDEIRAGLQYQVRLVSLTLFYMVIAADVVINESVLVFIMALLIALASIIYAISSKNRAFLFTGVGFMVLIIIFQLMMFYPDGRLARALILMLLGAIITGSMIWFNIKREDFLSRIRLFRADLDSWS